MFAVVVVDQISNDLLPLDFLPFPPSNLPEKSLLVNPESKIRAFLLVDTRERAITPVTSIRRIAARPQSESIQWKEGRGGGEERTREYRSKLENFAQLIKIEVNQQLLIAGDNR